jgi:type IV secretory pathway VirJ component
VRDVRRADDLPIAPALARLRGTPMLCVYGTGETESACRDADPSLIERIARRGDHHFDRDYAALADIILRRIDRGADTHAQSSVPRRKTSAIPK